jgi:hypothetical protein
MTRVKMIKSQIGSYDGFTVVTFAEGQEYDVPDNLLASFIELGAVEIVENAAVTEAPENAAMPRKRGRPRRGEV